nr:Meiosis-specific protein ASY1 [Ipomoea batatas]
MAAVSFSYSNFDSQEVMMNVNRTGTKKRGTFKCNSDTEITPNEVRDFKLFELIHGVKAHFEGAQGSAKGPSHIMQRCSKVYA